MNCQFSNTTSPANSQVRYSINRVVLWLTSGFQVKIDRVGLRVHLCADSLAAITAFSGDITSVFKTPGEDRYV
jgi:hypothetical protein